MRTEFNNIQNSMTNGKPVHGHQDIEKIRQNTLSFKSGLLQHGYPFLLDKFNASYAANFFILYMAGVAIPKAFSRYHKTLNDNPGAEKGKARLIFEKETFTVLSIATLPPLMHKLITVLVGESVKTPKHLLNEYKNILKEVIQDKNLQEELNLRRSELAIPTTKGISPSSNRELYYTGVKRVIIDNFYRLLIEKSIPQNVKERDELIVKLRNELNPLAFQDIKHIKNIISDYNKKHFISPQHPFHIQFPKDTLGKTTNQEINGRIDILVSTAKNYINDVVTKISSMINHSEVEKMVDNAHIRIEASKAAIPVFSLLAIGGALKFIYSKYHSREEN